MKVTSTDQNQEKMATLVRDREIKFSIQKKKKKADNKWPSGKGLDHPR